MTGPGSLFTRWWAIVKPLPPTHPVDKAELTQRRKQRKLVSRTVLLVLVLSVGWYGYTYVASAPQRARVPFDLGMKQAGAGNYRDAVTDFDRAIDIWPEFAEAYLNRGIAQHNLGQKDVALIDLDKAMDLNPQLTRACDERGRIYFEQGNAQKAIDQFSQSIKIQPTTDGYYQRANAYELLGNHQKAIEDYDRAIAEMTDAPYAYRARALAKANLGDAQGAQADRARADEIEQPH